MTKYKLLIIDDDLKSRKTGYERVLGSDYFDIEYIENASPAELSKIKVSKAHAFILDVNLDNWAAKEKSDLFKEVVDLILMRAPVFLISNNWNQENIKWVNHSKDIINIRYYLSWDNDIQAVLNSTEDFSYSAVRENIKRELDEFYAKESLVLDDDESISILQISDLQFGDNGFDEDTKLLEHLIPIYLKAKNIPVHLIALVGDIVFAGLPTEYEMAKVWLEKFCPELLGQNFRSRLLLIPGNHDVNLRLNAADLYKFDFKSNRLTEIADHVGDEHHAYGLTPYKEFAFEMTGNSAYISNQNHLNFVNDRFLNWGIRFYHLNSVSEQNYKQPDKAGIPEKYLSHLLDSPATSASVYNILLSHHDPQSYGYDAMNNWKSEWNSVSKFIQSANIKLFLHGHRHQFRTYSFQDDGKGLDDIRLHMTGTMSLRVSHRMAESKRGFSIIDLPRKNGTVQTDKITITDFGIERGLVNIIAKYDLGTVRKINIEQ